jgi:hypothetical protein
MHINKNPLFMKKIITLFLLSVLLTSTFTGCGVMFGGSKFNGSIIAKDHPKAKIFVSGNKVGEGTASIIHPRNLPLIVEVKQDGCESKTQTFTNTFRTGNFILSLITWGLIGIAVDLGTGAAYKPDHISNPAIQQMSDKNFVFSVDYSDCGEPVVVK